MKVIAVYNHKGGVGKTVTAVNFAYNLSVLGYRVLLIDMEPAGKQKCVLWAIQLKQGIHCGFSYWEIQSFPLHLPDTL